MTERVISYLLLLAATVAVLLVVIIQPRNTLIQKQRMMQETNLNLADACMTQYGMTCEEFTMMMTCTSTPGYTWSSGTCTPPATTCNGSSCTAETCQAMANMGGGYYWNAETQTCNITSGGGSSGSVAAIGGISANEKLSQRIESQCLAHVEKSGYGETVKKYGWYNNVRTYANNACTYAYLATNGKFSSNNDLYSIANLLTNDLAVRQEDIGMLYQALEDAPAPKKDQSLDDYLDIKKDGVAKYLKDVMDIMATFNDLTTDQPPYLAEPLPYVTKKAAEKYNAQYGTKIISLEEKLLALLPQPEIEKIVVIEDPAPETKKAEPEKEVVVAEEKVESPAPIRRQAVALLTKIINKFKEIRENGEQSGIARTNITRDINTMTKDFLRTQEVIRAFETCLKGGAC